MARDPYESATDSKSRSPEGRTKCTGSLSTGRDPRGPDEKVPVGRREIHRPRLHVVLVLRELHSQLRAPREHLGEEGPVAWIEVLDHQDGHREIGAQHAEHH